MSLESAAKRHADLREHLHATHPIGGSAQLFVGPVLLDLRNGRGWSVGGAEVVVQRDVLTLRFADRILAVMGRDIFREWLIHPQTPFEIDDVTWFTEADVTCLTIDGQVTYAVPSAAVGVLRGLV